MRRQALQQWAKTQSASARFGDLPGWMDMVSYGTLGIGTTYFVDSSKGNDGMDGTSWQTAFKTITKANAAAAVDYAARPNDGTTIFLKGTFAESVTAATAGTRFIGIGTGPRQAKWSPAAGNDKVNLTITGNYIEVAGIYFSPGAKSATYSACIEISNAGHANIHHNRFQGMTDAYYGIYVAACDATHSVDNVLIEWNKFDYFNTLTYGAAIRGINSGGYNFSTWNINNNKFFSCVTAIKLSSKGCSVKENEFPVGGVTALGATSAAVMTLGIDLSGDVATNSGGNTVFGNTLGGTYGTSLYKKGATGDNWGGNFTGIVGTYAPYGLTVDVPT